MDIERGGSPDSNLNFYDQVVSVEKGWVEQEFVLFIQCRIAAWSRVAKWVNILQDRLIAGYIGADYLLSKPKNPI